MSLNGKIALVTGASRGIGQAIAKELAVQNATVIGTATTIQGAEAISASLQSLGNAGKGIVLDVTQASSINDAISAIENEFGTTTILVNNAGITRDNLMLRMKDEEWNAVIETNLNAIYRVSKACLKGMLKARWGRIINISSVVGYSGNAGQVNYSTAKAGIIGFTKSLALEIASRGVTVNAVAPGFIETDMTKALSDDQRDALKKHIPLARIGEPDDIAAAVGFLASLRAGYITGETIHVNGGMYMA